MADDKHDTATKSTPDETAQAGSAVAPNPELSALQRRLADELRLEARPRDDGWLDVTVPAERVAEIARRLRDDFGLNYLSLLSAVDWKDKGFEIVYHLLELGTPRKLVMRARVPRDNPSLPSVMSVWPTADWHEREAWDLMGVKFEGHPDLRRILMPENWVGHPLRKDYVDQRPQRERQVKP